MRTLCLSPFCGLLLFSTQAMAINDFWAETLISSTSTATTYLTSRDRKLIGTAQDDATSFVASGGDVKGVYLEAAMDRLRTSYPQLRASDMHLAQYILTRDPAR